MRKLSPGDEVYWLKDRLTKSYSAEVPAIVVRAQAGDWVEILAITPNGKQIPKRVKVVSLRKR